MRRSRFVLCVFIAFAAGACSSEVAPEPTSGGRPARSNVTTEWFLRSISSDGKTIAIVYTMSGVASGCEREGSAFGGEERDKVTVLAYKSVTNDKNKACTEELAYVDEAVTLRRSLGDRALVGCRPGKTSRSEDRVCRDLERSKKAGVFEFSPPSGP